MHLQVFDVFSFIYALYIMSFNGINSAAGTFNIQLFTCTKGKGNSSFLPYLTNFYKTLESLPTKDNTMQFSFNRNFPM